MGLSKRLISSMKKLFVPLGLWELSRNFYLDLKYYNLYYRDAEVFEDLKVFTGLNYRDLIRRMRQGSIDVTRQFSHIDPASVEELMQFYKNLYAYIFDLSNWECNRNKRYGIDRRIAEASAGEVLDFGGGIGGEAIECFKEGLKVVYADVPGSWVWKFAKFRFTTRGYKVTIIDGTALEGRKSLYDTIICIDVLEHLPGPGSMLEKLVSSLRQRGRMIISLGFFLERNPLHFPTTFDFPLLMKSLGMEVVEKWEDMDHPKIEVWRKERQK